MTKLTILGSGAAPGVPSIAGGWGACNPENPKNRRRRSGAYLEIGEAKILIDTSPDLRCQFLDNQISYLDAVLYTHAHADHLHGIDDLRDLNRLYERPIDVYANQETCTTIKQRFPYLVADKEHPLNPVFMPSLIINMVNSGEPFFIKELKVTPIALAGHTAKSSGYVFNGGEIVYIADCKEIPDESLSFIKKRPELLIMPLTTIVPQPYHMGLDKLLEYVNIIQPRQTIINHMAIECDYDCVNAITPANVCPAYDNMIVEI